MINDNQIMLITSVLLKFAPKQIGLFGSRVRGDENKNSDLDILISFEDGKSPYSIIELLGLEKTMADKLGYPVEIVNEKSIKNVHLKHSILKDMIIIYPQIKSGI